MCMFNVMHDKKIFYTRGVIQICPTFIQKKLKSTLIIIKYVILGLNMIIYFFLFMHVFVFMYKRLYKSSHQVIEVRRKKDRFRG